MADFRTDQAKQFDVDWRDFVYSKAQQQFGQVFSPPKVGERSSPLSGPMNGEDIFSDRRSEGRRKDGR